jgi:hypothetical protein
VLLRLLLLELLLWCQRTVATGGKGARRVAAAAKGPRGGESFLRVHWVAVPEGLRARRANRRRRRLG